MNVDDLINKLHQAALDFDSYECALPVYDDDAMERMRVMVRKWYAEQHAEVLPYLRECAAMAAEDPQGMAKLGEAALRVVIGKLS